MAQWWMDDDQVDNHYRDQYERSHGYDPLDPEYDEDEYDYEDEVEEVWNG